MWIGRTANLGTKILDFRQNLNITGWSSHIHREFPRYFESTNLSRDNLSREIARSAKSLGSGASRSGARELFLVGVSERSGPLSKDAPCAQLDMQCRSCSGCDCNDKNNSTDARLNAPETDPDDR